MKVLLFLIILSTVPYIHSIDVATILEEGDKIITPPQLKGIFNLKLISRNKDIREVKAVAYQKQISSNQENRIFFFNYPPAVKGTGFLINSFFDDTANRMWIYLPSIRRIKRVALETSGGGYFMGSDFTYSDLISRSSEDFNYEMLGEEVLNGDMCYKLKTQGKTMDKRREVGYQYTINYYRKSDYVIVGIDYYDIAGELLKEYRVHKVEDLSGYLFPSQVIMSNIQTGHISEIEFTELIVEDIPDALFTHQALRVGIK